MSWAAAFNSHQSKLTNNIFLLLFMFHVLPDLSFSLFRFSFFKQMCWVHLLKQCRLFLSERRVGQKSCSSVFHLFKNFFLSIGSLFDNRFGLYVSERATVFFHLTKWLLHTFTMIKNWFQYYFSSTFGHIFAQYGPYWTKYVFIFLCVRNAYARRGHLKDVSKLVCLSLNAIFYYAVEAA